MPVDPQTSVRGSIQAEGRPLSNFRIIEINAVETPIATRLATALAAKIVADLGATVIRVESPAGDPLRELPPFLGRDATPRRSALFEFLNTSKRSAIIDVSKPTGKNIFQKLCSESDAVIADDANLIDIGRPRVGVLVRPFAEFDRLNDAVEEIEILAIGGLLDIIGDPQREPLKLGGHQCAYTAGLAAFTGLVSALASVPQGETEIVDVNLLDVAYWTNWKAFAERLYKGTTSSRLGDLAEWQVVPCSDGHAAIVYLEKDWPQLCRMVGNQDLQNSQFNTREGRQKNAEYILLRLRPWFAARTRAQIYATAKECGLPVAPVWRVGDLAQDPQFIAQKFLSSIEFEGVGPVTVPTVPVVWNGKRFAPRQFEEHE